MNHIQAMEAVIEYMLQLEKINAELKDKIESLEEKIEQLEYEIREVGER